MMMRHRSTFGFTLVEIAIVLTIIGVLLGSGILALGGVIQNYYYNATRTKMERLADSISLFVNHNYYIPCPAEPAAPAATAGVPRTSCTAPDTSASGTIGIVPYREIGLKLEDVTDAYGRLYTYVINPVFNEAAVRNQATVHDVCRVRASWINPDGDDDPFNFTYSPRPKFPAKAVFCCPDWSRPERRINLDPVVQNARGGVISPTRSPTGGAGPMDVIATPTDTRIDTVGFILLSHGRNGAGAFTGNATTPRILGANPASRPNEEINARNNTQVFVEAPESSNTDNYFDDLILWRTPSQALNVSGREGCAQP